MYTSSRPTYQILLFDFSRVSLWDYVSQAYWKQHTDGQSIQKLLSAAKWFISSWSISSWSISSRSICAVNIFLEVEGDGKRGEEYVNGRRDIYKTMTNLETANHCPSLPERRKKKKREGWEAQYLKFAKFITAYSKRYVLIRTCQCGNVGNNINPAA